MSPQVTLTGQDVGEAEGALTGLLERILARTNSGLSRFEYITLRVLSAHGRFESNAALNEYLADQPQLGLDRSQVAALLDGLEARGLIRGGSASTPGPAGLTEAGAALHAAVVTDVMTVTRRLYSELNPDELATAHNVLTAVTQRARRLRNEL